MKFRKMLACCLALLMLLSTMSGMATTVAANDSGATPEVYLELANSNALGAKSTFFVFIKIKNNPGLSALALQFDFDKNNLSMTGGGAVAPTHFAAFGATQAPGEGCLLQTTDEYGVPAVLGGNPQVGIDRSRIAWTSSTNTAAEDGYLFFVKFETSENAINGDYDISISRADNLDSNFAYIVDKSVVPISGDLSGVSVSITNGIAEPVTNTTTAAVPQLPDTEEGKVPYGTGATITVPFNVASYVDNVAFSVTGNYFEVAAKPNEGAGWQTGGQNVEVTLKKDAPVGTHDGVLTVSYETNGISCTSTAYVRAIVEPATPTLTIADGSYGFAYGGQPTAEPSLTNAPTGIGAVTYYVSTSADDSAATTSDVTWAAFKESSPAPGTYYLYATSAATDKYLAGKSAKVEFAVSEQDVTNQISAELAEGVSFTYTGSAIEPTKAQLVVKFNNVEVGENDYNITYGTNAESGENFTVAAGGTYTITPAGKYSGTGANFEFSIGRKAVTVTGPTTTFGYKGGALPVDKWQCTVSDSSEELKGLTFSYGCESYTGSNAVGTILAITPKVTNTESYPNHTFNYVDGKLEIVAASISGATVTVNTTYTYDGTPKTPDGDDITVTVGGATLTYGTDYQLITENPYEDNTNAGKNTASFTIEGMGNYSGTKTVIFSIGKKELSITAVDLISRQYKPNDTSVGVRIVTFGDGVNLTMGTDYIVTSADMENADAGENKPVTVNITLKDLADRNYQLKSSQFSTNVTITKATPEYTTPNNLTATYGQTLADVQLPGNFAWKDATTTSVGDAGNNTFKVTYTPGDTTNYNTVEDIDVTVAVAKANPVAGTDYTVPTGLTATYGQTLDDVELPTGFAWKDANTTSVGNAGSSIFKVTYTPDDTTNYNTVKDINVTVDVAKADWPDDKKAAAGSARYGNSGEVDLADYIADGAKVTLGTTTDAETVLAEAVSYDETTKKLSFKFKADAVPERTASVALTVAGATNYNDYELTVTLTVNDKELDNASMTIAQTGCTYGETLPNYTLTGEPTEKHTTTVLYTGTTRANDLYTSSTKPTEAGTYTVKVTCETANKVYEATSTEFTVAPANIAGATVALGASLTYNGSEQTQDITSATLNGKDILPSSTVSGNTVTDAGSYTLTITANSSSNYVGTKEVNFTVAKATPVITGGTPATATGTYGINLKDIFLSNGPTVKLSANASSVVLGNWRFTDDVVLNAGTYEKQATFTPTVTKNINPVTTTVTVTINKATWSNTSSIGSAKYGNDGMVDLSNQLAAGYQVGTISVTDADGVLAGAPVVTAGILKYKFVNDAAKVGKTATITIPVTSSTNYNAYEIAVEVRVLDKYAPVVAAENITVTYTGSPVSADLIKGTATHNGATVAGTWAFASGVNVTNVQSGSVEVIFTPTNTDDYATVSTTITLTINKATPSGAPVFEPVKEDGKTLGDIQMPNNLGGVPGTFTWRDGNDTKIERGKEYQWTFTPDDEDNYNSYIGTSIPWPNSAISVPTWHNIYVNVTGNGTAKTDVTKQKAGQPVVVTVTPDPGYKLGSLVVTDYNGNALALTREGLYTYSFTMPQMRAYVNVSFILEAFPFTDVPVDAWFRGPVEYVYENGIMGGIGGSLFAPDMTTTRGMIVTMLHRIEGCPVPKSVGTFTDVASNAYYAQAADWAAENGIVGGYGNGKFGPNDPIQREQMAAILYRYAQYKGMDAVTLAEYLGGFPDVSNVSSYAVSALNWAVGAGIINGVGDKLMPQGNATRAQVAAMLQRFLTK